jgi:hypothetical protein
VCASSCDMQTSRPRPFTWSKFLKFSPSMPKPPAYRCVLSVFVRIDFIRLFRPALCCCPESSGERFRVGSLWGHFGTKCPEWTGCAAAQVSNTVSFQWISRSRIPLITRRSSVRIRPPPPPRLQSRRSGQRTHPALYRQPQRHRQCGASGVAGPRYHLTPRILTVPGGSCFQGFANRCRFGDAW